MVGIRRGVGKVEVEEELHLDGVDDGGVVVLLVATSLVLVVGEELGVADGGEVEDLGAHAGHAGVAGAAGHDGSETGAGGAADEDDALGVSAEGCGVGLGLSCRKQR